MRYDKTGDNHYDTVSAFIKSMRGSDPDAAVYYLARMLYAGEDIKFIARRIMICAAEDVSNADPMALVVATSAAQAVERIGMPEAQIIFVAGGHVCGKCAKEQLGSQCDLRCDGSSKEYEKQRRSRFIYRMHITSHPENWGMVLDINMHMIIRIIMWISNICRMD